MKRVFLLGLIFLSACQSADKAEGDNYEPPAFRDYSLGFKEGKKIYGNRVNIEVVPADNKELDKILKNIQKSFDAKLTQLGFQVVSTRINADLWLVLRLYQTELARIEESNNKSDSNRKVYYLRLDGHRQEYGKRPSPLLWSYAWGDVEVSEIGYKFLSSAGYWADDFVKVRDLIEKRDQKGAPGCSPRFGFIGKFDPQDPNSNAFRITRIFSEGPAKRADLKVGDIFKSVNGIDYKDTSMDDERIYDMSKAHKVLVVRNGKEITVEMRPEIMCE